MKNLQSSDASGWESIPIEDQSLVLAQLLNIIIHNSCTQCFSKYNLFNNIENLTFQLLCRHVLPYATQGQSVTPTRSGRNGFPIEAVKYVSPHKASGLHPNPRRSTAGGRLNFGTPRVSDSKVSQAYDMDAH